MAKKQKVDLYQKITDQIIEQLEEGIIPWRKPWHENGLCNAPMRWKVQEPYQGINRLLLPPGEYATFKQIKEAGGKVKKGSKSHLVVFWTPLIKKVNTKDNSEDDSDEDNHEDYESRLFFYSRYSNVFEINTQVEGLESKREKKEIITNDFERIENCEKIFEKYRDKPTVTNERTGAWYRPTSDILNVPPLEDFKFVEGYYSTLFHESIHSTGHKDRLNRKGITKFDKFGSEQYSKEELIAELGAIMLCAEGGLYDETFDNSASYIDGWLKKLRDDKSFIISASQQAQKAVEYIKNNDKNKEKEQETKMEMEKINK